MASQRPTNNRPEEALRTPLDRYQQGGCMVFLEGPLQRPVLEIRPPTAHQSRKGRPSAEHVETLPSGPSEVPFSSFVPWKDVFPDVFEVVFPERFRRSE